MTQRVKATDAAKEVIDKLREQHVVVVRVSP